MRWTWLTEVLFAPGSAAFANSFAQCVMDQDQCGFGQGRLTFSSVVTGAGTGSRGLSLRGGGGAGEAAKASSGKATGGRCLMSVGAIKLVKFLI